MVVARRIRDKRLERVIRKGLSLGERSAQAAKWVVHGGDLPSGLSAADRGGPVLSEFKETDAMMMLVAEADPIVEWRLVADWLRTVGG